MQTLVSHRLRGWVDQPTVDTVRTEWVHFECDNKQMLCGVKRCNPHADAFIYLSTVQKLYDELA